MAEGLKSNLALRIVKWVGSFFALTNGSHIFEVVGPMSVRGLTNSAFHANETYLTSRATIFVGVGNAK